ncbi:amidase [Winogradskyella sp. DF17]|uniref:Amidase n=1 Tax=Winogradskyella pelagia TaxID=2819984 RepID=A0ABS3T1X5_9FLAO|nr:amidase family protein [Winogradskyella sp. DF17]MBO3116751.1 amidase [Winogradskyella sp. DF17]
MRYTFFFLVFLLIFSCKNDKQTTTETPTETQKIEIDNTEVEVSSDDDDLEAISAKDFREFLVLDSKVITKAELWADVSPQMEDFSDADYSRIAPMVLEQDIPTIQSNITDGKFSYEELTKFYLYRIRKYDRENDLSLNSVISVNPNVIKEARARDKALAFNEGADVDSLAYTVYGMPILLKDNINTEDLPTTAGALALKDNKTEDAFIVNQLRSKGALILGKANLSEWAYFFCGECPSGYSAIGGQTLNPYGRRTIDTGGSSSGSGVSAAANFAAATIGSETSGSILSPASQNSVVGLKPTIGLVSRSGIVPISSTLDTAGPITRTVIDNAIVLDAIFGEDTTDSKAFMVIWESGFYTKKIKMASLEGKRFGAPKRFLEDSLFVNALEVLKQQGAEIVEIEDERVSLPNFINLLNLDMRKDLPLYMENYADKTIELRTVADVMAFNEADSALAMPYGQALFKGIVDDKGDDTFLERIKDTLKTNGKLYFDTPFDAQKIDGFLSINNYHAGQAAVAEYPALTVPMGYTKEGIPKGLTFIGRRLQEKQLLEWAYVYEQASKMRVPPKGYN